MITTVHTPYDDRIFQKEAKTLAKLYPTILIVPSDEESINNVDGIQLITVKKYKSKVLHPLNIWQIYNKALKTDCNVYHCHELGSMIICLILKKLKKVKVVYDVHEHWPSQIPHDIGIQSNGMINKLFQAFVLNFELLLSHHADEIIAVSDSVAERFRKDGREVEIIKNVPILSFMGQIGPSHGPLKHLIYMGGKLQLSHGLKECITAVKMVKSRYPDISLTIVGRVDSNLDPILKEEGNNIVTVTGLLPYSEMYHKIHEGGVGILTFKKDYYNKYIGLPNKLFDYMLCGLPVIASDFPEISKIVKESGCGILVNPSDPVLIYEAICYLLDHPDEAERKGKAGRKIIEERYNWAIEEKKLFAIYDSLS